MNITEFKKRILDLKLINNNSKEKQRFHEMTNRSLYGINIKTINTPSQIREAWLKYNKLQEEWEEIDSRLTQTLNKSTGCIDFSHLAYNGVTDDF